MNILIIISIVISAVTLLLIAGMFIFKPKSMLSTIDIISTLEKENEKLRKEISVANIGQADWNKQVNDMLIKTIESYNNGVLQTLHASQSAQAEMLKQVETRLHNISQTNANLAEVIDVKLNKINEDNIRQLTEMRITVDEKLNTNLTTRLNESFNIISERLEALYKGFGEIQTLSAGVSDLNKVLNNVKVRGTFGEVQLNALLEQMLTNNQYESNVQIKQGSAERVEFAIVLPGKDEKNIFLPIDAKFPMEDYSRLVNAKDKAEEHVSLKAIEKRIKTEAKSIREKYIYPPHTTDFALMYIPLEGLYADILKIDGLTDFIQREYRVIICSPTTLAALLSSLQMGFKTLYIEKRSSEIWELLASFRREFGAFIDLLGKTQKKILEANDTIENATKKTKKIQKQLMQVTSSAPEYLIDADENTENFD